MLQKIDLDRMGSQLFPALAFNEEDGLFLLEDKSLGFGFLCDPLSGADQAVADRVNVFLNQEWPVDTLIQVSLWTSPDIQGNLTHLKSRRAGSVAPLCRDLAGNTLSFLQEGTAIPLDAASGLLIRRCQIIISVKLPLGKHAPSDSECERARTLRTLFVKGV